MDRLLTLDDSAERWSVSRAVALEIVREGAIPYLCLWGDPLGRGRKALRFRPEAVAEWERNREVVDAPADRGGQESPAPPPRAAGGRRDADGLTAAERKQLYAMGWSGNPHF